MGRWPDKTSVENIFNGLSNMEYINKEKFRVCHVCKKVKPLIDFSKNWGVSRGYNYNCKECGKKEGKKQYHNDQRPFSTFISAYKRIINKIKSRDKKLPHPSFTLDYVLQLAESQEYKCALTGISLLKIKNGMINRHPHMPSIDRIDRTKGYEIGNIRWVCWWANLSRNVYTDEEFYDMCREATEFKENKT